MDRKEALEELDQEMGILELAIDGIQSDATDGLRAHCLPGLAVQMGRVREAFLAVSK
ncbi:MAG: hypothetical protein PHC61_04565 [Chitinivibrionales bacterium]|nr:hypothetical protein [Chitinivibrionales bacterium]